MKITIRINDQLYRLATQLADNTHRSISEVVEEALRETLRPTVKIKLPTFKGNGLQPGIDLDDTNSLLEAMI
jgi:predicted transcriptional regulator